MDLPLEVVWLTEGYGQIVLLEGHHLPSWDDHIERCSNQVEVDPNKDLNPVKAPSIEDVVPTSTIHEHLGEVHLSHNRADHKPEPTKDRHMVGVVILIEGDCHLGPPQEQRNCKLDCIHFLFRQLLPALRLIGLGPTKDHEATLNVGDSMLSTLSFMLPSFAF